MADWIAERHTNYHKSIILQFEEEAELFNVAVKSVREVFDEFVVKLNSGHLTAGRTGI